jgi:DNA-binding FadR family transcriptional regulator
MGDESEVRVQNRRQTFDLAMKSLEKLVEAGSNTDETPLPPERQLAMQLGISRRMLRTGLDRLEAAGRIWRHQGKGTFLGARPPLDTKDILRSNSATNPLEVLEARSELEPSLAALAALRATPTELREIRRYLDRSQSATDLETFELWDGTLHRAIAQAAHNSLLLSLYDVVNIARSRSFWGRLQDAAINRCGLYCIWQQHKAVVDALTERDPVAARRLMQAHIEAVRTSMFDLVNRPARRGRRTDSPPRQANESPEHGRHPSP